MKNHQDEIHINITTQQAVAIFLSLKKLDKVGPETGMLYHQLEKSLYERIGLHELQELEVLYLKGEL